MVLVLLIVMVKHVIYMDVRSGDINLRGSLNGINSSKINYLSNVTSDIQTQFTNNTS
jgi:hypothetical protein